MPAEALREVDGRYEVRITEELHDVSYLDQVRLFSLPQLVAMHRRVLETDLQLKTGQQEPALALELSVAELAGQAGQAGQARPPQRAVRR